MNRNNLNTAIVLFRLLVALDDCSPILSRLCDDGFEICYSKLSDELSECLMRLGFVVCLDFKNGARWLLVPVYRPCNEFVYSLPYHVN